MYLTHGTLDRYSEYCVSFFMLFGIYFNVIKVLKYLLTCTNRVSTFFFLLVRIFPKY